MLSHRLCLCYGYLWNGSYDFKCIKFFTCCFTVHALFMWVFDTVFSVFLYDASTRCSVFRTFICLCYCVCETFVMILTSSLSAVVDESKCNKVFYVLLHCTCVVDVSIRYSVFRIFIWCEYSMPCFSYFCMLMLWCLWNVCYDLNVCASVIKL